MESHVFVANDQYRADEEGKAILSICGKFQIYRHGLVALGEAAAARRRTTELRNYAEHVSRAIQI